MATIGRFEIRNSAVNVVPGNATLSVDVRSSRDEDRAAAVEEIAARVQEIALRRSVKARMAINYDMPAAPCDSGMMGRLDHALKRGGHEAFRLPSGAGHDAMSFRDRMPHAMLFVRCRGGVSHRPDEFASEADIASALAVLEDFIETFGAEA